MIGFARLASLGWTGRLPRFSRTCPPPAGTEVRWVGCRCAVRRVHQKRLSAPSSAHGARWQYGVGSLDSTPLNFTQLAGDQVTPAVAGNPDGFLVAWVAASKVFYARVDRAGQVLEAPVLLGDGSAPAVTWATDHFLAVWVRGTELVGARVSAQGVLLDALPFIVSASTDTQLNPALASGPAGEALVTYEAFDSSPSIQGIVARARFIRDEPVIADAGVEDGGVPAMIEDAGITEPDAGTVEDAGSSSTADAGTDDDDGGVSVNTRSMAYRVGCSCDAVGVQWGALFVLLIGLLRRFNSPTPTRH